MKRLARSQAGFTLLEIMLVVMIIALLAGAAIWGMKDNVGVARDARAKGDLNSITTALMMYQAANGHFPSTEQGLKALVTKPTTEPRPRQWRQLMKEVPLDPWQVEYRYERPGTRSQDGYDLYSSGADNQPNTSDDIGNWKTET